MNQKINLLDKSLFGRTLAFYGLLSLWVSLTFSIALTNISFVVALVGWGIWKFQEKESFSQLLPKHLAIPLSAFVGLALISAFFSEYPANSVRGMEKLIKQVLVFLITYDVFRDSFFMRKYEKVFLFTAWLVLINALCQYTLGKDFIRLAVAEPSGAGVRLSASFGTYGKLGAFLVLTISFVIGLGLYLKKHFKNPSRFYLSLIVSIGLVIVLFLTRSRGAMLSFAIAVSLILLLRRKFLILGILIALGGAFVMSLPRNMIIHLDAEQKEQSLVERYYLWDRALHVIRAKPITGTGVNTYSSAHAKYDKTQNWRVRNYYAHNGYLQLAAETGLPCLFALLWFFTAYFKISFQALQTHPATQGPQIGILTGLFGFLIFALVDTVYHSLPPVMTFWYLMGLQLAYAFPRQTS